MIKNNNSEQIQEKYGELIFNFPIRIQKYSNVNDDAGDFYLYCFDNDRIIKRVAGFRNDNEIQFKNYLICYVLKSLFLDWLATKREISTVSLDAPVQSQIGEVNPGTIRETLSSENGQIEGLKKKGFKIERVKHFLLNIPPEKRILIKLVSLAEIRLSNEDYRTIARVSGRTARETIIKVESAFANIFIKDEKAEMDDEQISIVSYRIREAEKNIHKLDEKIEAVRHINDEGLIQTIVAEKAELERKLIWRRKQHEDLLKKACSVSTGLPYKIIADILNCPIGSVASGIARLREKLHSKLLEKENG